MGSWAWGTASCSSCGKRAPSNWKKAAKSVQLLKALAGPIASEAHSSGARVSERWRRVALSHGGSRVPWTQNSRPGEVLWA